ncbi:hypothetical protein OZX62_07525 [Bifidobacterium sp. ESL0690]|uniref:leucine-rich repeat domain-containing protein n=1 Tax=Bifidobacterium sp. ESL0690 TaxID=2983214 RepID=UPI0023F9C0E1|nr:leucine-rich repeat domain-containing protein [Bifidobacterium sp. ESL0690]WEV46288.1 hypothetical protein OZX62_07525 [Bifidobacterium sp. ESL0690]
MRFTKNGLRGSLAACVAGVAAVAMLVPGSANAVETRGSCSVGTSTIAQCFPDTRLAADVAVKGGVAVGDVFTQHIADTVLEVDGNFNSLQGVQHLTNLATIHSQYSGVSDLSPLSGLRHLTKITLEHSSVSDLSPLAGLTQLVRLDFTYGHISDLSPIRGLTNLEVLNVDRNNITDITPLSGLTRLRHIEAWDNHIRDLRPVKAVAPYLSWTDPDTGGGENPFAGQFEESTPSATWLQAPMGLNGEYIEPYQITPSSGTYNPTTGVVSWSGLNEGDEISIDVDYHFPNEPDPIASYTYSAVGTYSTSGPAAPQAPAHAQQPGSGPAPVNRQKAQTAATKASGALPETGISVLGIAGVTTLMLLLGAGLFMARRHA